MFLLLKVQNQSEIECRRNNEHEKRTKAGFARNSTPELYMLFLVQLLILFKENSLFIFLFF
ncbi:MAG: hypothetical protein D3924_14910 [Candidatus Electrothrix sp. AR4]|nr:hypothetical protein [Candidatus Electrothrix sp. AR4]